MMLRSTLIIPRITVKINSHLIMFMMMIPSSQKYTVQRLNSQLCQLCKDIMLLSLHTAKLELERHLLWKDLNIICMMSKEVLSQEPFKIYSDISRAAKMKKQNLWSGHPISKFTTKLLVIFLDMRKIIYKLGKIVEEVCMSKEFLNGL